MILCADATLDGEQLIGDPTEGALIVLAAKGGLDIDETRRTYPRIAEVPFDAAYKFMATFHNMTDDAGKPVVRCFVKGAPDVLIGRGSSYWAPTASCVAVTDQNRHLALDENDRLAAAGQRVMVVAQRDFDPATFDPNGNLIDLVTGPDAAGDGRHRRSAARRSEGRHRRVQERRHPRAHDHRRPRHDRRRDRRGARASRAGPSPAPSSRR